MKPTIVITLLALAAPAHAVEPICIMGNQATLIERKPSTQPGYDVLMIQRGKEWLVARGIADGEIFEMMVPSSETLPQLCSQLNKAINALYLANARARGAFESDVCNTQSIIDSPREAQATLKRPDLAAYNKINLERIRAYKQQTDGELEQVHHLKIPKAPNRLCRTAPSLNLSNA
jgi:hypothetical protein